MKRMHISLFVSICFINLLQARSASGDARLSKVEPVEQRADITPANLLSSIQEELKDPRYRQDILPNNFSYLIQLLRYGNQAGQPRDYYQNVLSLFSKLLKGSEYVN